MSAFTNIISDGVSNIKINNLSDTYSYFNYKNSKLDRSFEH